MKQIILLLIFVIFVGLIETLPEPKKAINCANLTTEGFDVKNILGLWYITNKSPKRHYCVEFANVTDDERNNYTLHLDEYVYVKGMNWSRYSLKVDMPCRREFTNDSQIHLLEKVDDKGLYRSFVIPEDRAKLDNILPYTVLLKMVNIQGKSHMAFLGCDHPFLLIFGRERKERFEQAWIKDVRQKFNITAEFN